MNSQESCASQSDRSQVYLNFFNFSLKFLDFSGKFFGFLGEIFWISQLNFWIFWWICLYFLVIYFWISLIASSHFHLNLIALRCISIFWISRWNFLNFSVIYFWISRWNLLNFSVIYFWISLLAPSHFHLNLIAPRCISIFWNSPWNVLDFPACSITFPS